MDEKNPNALRVADLSRTFGISKATVLNYINRGLLTPDIEVTHGCVTYRYFQQKTVDDFVKSCVTGRYHLGERIISSGEACQILGIAQSTFNEHVKKGNIKPDIVLPPTKNGKTGRRFYTMETLNAYRDSREGGSFGG